MKFEFYVINYDFNAKKAKMYNVFNNIRVQESTEKEIKKYLRAPSKYCRKGFGHREDIYGFEGLCSEIDSIIGWQEHFRCEYEIAVGYHFTIEAFEILQACNDFIAEGKSIEDFKEYLEVANRSNFKLERWDCYEQCKPNIEMITRECIYQYKKQLKEQKNEL